MRNQLSEIHNLEKMNGKIIIHHALYGNQKIVGNFHIINDGERVGVKVKNNELFLWENEITDIKVNGNCIIIQGEIMQIQIEV